MKRTILTIIANAAGTLILVAVGAFVVAPMLGGSAPGSGVPPTTTE